MWSLNTWLAASRICQAVTRSFIRQSSSEEAIQGGDAGLLAPGSLAVGREDVQGPQLALAGQPEGAGRGLRQALGDEAVDERPDLVGRAGQRDRQALRQSPGP